MKRIKTSKVKNELQNSQSILTNNLKSKKQSSSKPYIKIKEFKRYSHNIWWIWIPFVVILLTAIIVMRFTLVGVFLDDGFSLVFGFGRYFLYLFLLSWSLFLISGFKITFSKKAKVSLFLLFLTVLWMLSNLTIIFYVQNHEDPLWTSHYFKLAINQYVHFWYVNSIFAGEIDLGKLFFGWSKNFWMLGGGILGIFMAALGSLASVPMSVILNVICFLLIIFWIFNLFHLLSFKHHRIAKKAKLEAKRLEMKKQQLLLTVEQQKAKEEEERFQNYHHSLASKEIIDSNFLFKNTDNDLLAKDIDATHSPHIFKKPPTILDEMFAIPSYSNYVKEDFELENENINNTSDNMSVTSASNFDLNQNNEQNLDQESAFTSADSSDNYDDLLNQDEVSDFDSDESNTNDLNQDSTNDDYLDDGYEEVDDNDEDLEFGSEFSEDDYDGDVDSDFDEEDEMQSSLQKTDHYIENDLIYHDNSINYQMPSASLIAERVQGTNINQANWENANFLAQKIMDVFKQFNVLATIQSTNVGPQVTKFEIMPDPGTKVKKIIALEYDLKLALATNSLRIEAPIQGKSFIGLEIPNKSIALISFASMLKNIPPKLANEKLLIGLGKKVDNEFMYLKLNKLPHLLISGTTGSGKSICIKSIISSLIMHASPNELKLLLIDLKRVELKIFSKLPHLLAPIIYDYKKAVSALKIITKEMENRYNLFSQHNVTNIDSYNLISNHKLPNIVVVIDELADLMMVSKSEVEEYITRIAQMARASGIYLIIATQRPSTDVVTGLIKTNIPSRISFYLNSSIDSRTIIDTSGAEKLISKGDMLYKGLDTNHLVRLQGIYIYDDEINQIVDYWKNQQNATFDQKFMDDQSNENSYGKIDFNHKDSMYDEIKRYVLNEKKASVSLLQRRFSIGYIRASKIIDMLEAEKVIGPQNGSKPRSLCDDEGINHHA